LRRDQERTRGKKLGFVYKREKVFSENSVNLDQWRGSFVFLSSNVKESWSLIPKKLLIWVHLAVVYWNGIYANN